MKALEILSIATRQRQHCRLIHFEESVRRLDDFPANQVNPEQLLTSIEVFFDHAIEYTLIAALDASDLSIRHNAAAALVKLINQDPSVLFILLSEYCNSL